jgi:uncharacterized protein YoxC
MTNEQMERAIEFLLDHHAKMSADIERHSEQIGRLTQAVASLTGDVHALTGNVEALTGNVEAMREEVQDGFNKLIVANEVTRKLSEDVARLNVGMSQRLTVVERRVDDLESKE